MKVNFRKILFLSVCSGLIWASATMAQEEVLEANEDSFVLEEQEVPEEIQEEIPANEPEEPVQIYYTWENFLNGENCSDQFAQLKGQDFLSEEEQTFMSLMGRYCAKEVNIWSSLLSTFRQNKKALLMDLTSKEKSFVNKYLKKVLYALVDIHKKTPTGDDIHATLDRIENAIQEKNVEEVEGLISDLPDHQRLFLIPLLNETEQLINFKQML